MGSVDISFHGYKCQQTLARISKLSIFDPACGSGNFLIIAYKELRKLEIKIFKRWQELSPQMSLPFSWISLTQFYGIEKDNFACEIAILSLWLAVHQMNLLFKDTFGFDTPFLPLKNNGNIVCANALEVDWETICSKENKSEIYILGNPPYQGFKMQSREQKNEMNKIFSGFKNFKNLDYISCWFYLASNYINEKVKVGFVSTSSICQGTQVSPLWSNIFKLGVEIFFTVLPFQWTNNAKKNAGVSCIIVGLRKNCNKPRYIIKNIHSIIAKNINAYLIDYKNIFIEPRRYPISKLPKISDGSGALDGGNLILSDEEKKSLEHKYPESKKYIYPYTGSSEFIKGIRRWCLWIDDNCLQGAQKIPDIYSRIQKVYKFRLHAGTRAKTAVSRPHKFAWINMPKTTQIIIPTVSSERRDYIPMGYLDSNTIVSNSASIVHDPEPYIFGLITSKMHMVWVKATAGRLRSDYRYTSAMCYNTFPVPELSKQQKNIIQNHVFNILDEREYYSEKTKSELYDPNKMPDSLREAHLNLDKAVELCYRTTPFKNDEDRLEHLLKLYEKLTLSENE